MSSVKFLPDYASREDETGISLQKVGVRRVYVRRRWIENDVITKQSAYVSLERNKGIHMSRLTDVLLLWEGEPIECANELLKELSDTHDGATAYWKCRWKNLVEFMGGARVKLDYVLEGRTVGDECRWYFTIVMPYASVCPCSMEMCRAVRRGVPHMQRSKVSVTVRLKDGVELSEINAIMEVDLAESVKLLPKPVMKREEELAWCIEAEKNPMFVEDVARVVANAVQSKWDFVDDYVIVVEHEESIHEHNAVAVVWKGDELR